MHSINRFLCGLIQMTLNINITLCTDYVQRRPYRHCTASRKRGGMYHSSWGVNNNLNKRRQRNGTRTALFRRPQQFCVPQWKALMVWWMRWDLMAPLWRLQSLCCQRGSLKSWTFRPSITQCSWGTLREKMHDSYSNVLKSIIKSFGIYVKHYPCSIFVKAKTASNMLHDQGDLNANVLT